MEGEKEVKEREEGEVEGENEVKEREEGEARRNTTNIFRGALRLLDHADVLVRCSHNCYTTSCGPGR